MPDQDLIAAARAFIDTAAHTPGVDIEVRHGWTMYESMLRAAPELVQRLLAYIAEVEAERDRLGRGAQTLGVTVDRQCRAVLDATGLHHLIDADGDGDWGLVWERLAEMGSDLRAARARIAELEAREARVGALSTPPFGEAYEHADCAEAACPACWVEDIRRALGEVDSRG